MSSLAVRTPAPERAAPTPTRSIIYLGMDAHKDSITIAVGPTDAKTPTRLERLPNDPPHRDHSPRHHERQLHRMLRYVIA